MQPEAEKLKQVKDPPAPGENSFSSNYYILFLPSNSKDGFVLKLYRPFKIKTSGLVPPRSLESFQKWKKIERYWLAYLLF